MRKNILFFANTLWFLEKFKYDLIKNLSKNNSITCVFLRKGPSYDIKKIDQLSESNNVDFYSLKSFIFYFLKKIICSLINHKSKIFVFQKIIIFTIGPILISCFLPNIYKRRTIYVLEGLGRIFSSKTILNQYLKIIIKRIYKFLFLKCDLVFVLNSYDYLFLVENKICPVYKIRVLPGTGIDNNKIDKLINRKKSKYIDYIGRLIIEKGYYKFILTKLNFKKYFPQIDMLYTFRIICPQSDIDNLSKKELDFLKKLNIKIKPYLIEPYEYYNETKALIVPSYYGEGLSRVVLEASYIGLPILATRIRGIEEILSMDYKYYLKSNNPFSISQQLAAMIQDEAYFNKIKDTQKIHIKNNFSTTKSVEFFKLNLFKDSSN